MLHEIDSAFIDDMLQEMAMTKTYYQQQLRKRLRNTRKAKNLQNLKKIEQVKNQSSSAQMRGSLFASPAKSQNSSNNIKLISTFVNIKHARYQIGPAQTYNFKNIEFPDIGQKKSRSPRPKQNPQQFNQSFQLMNSSVKYVQRSHVKQSWNRYVDINNLNKSEDQNDKQNKNNRNRYRRAKKDTTQENIEGWKSFYNFDVDADINNVARG